MASQLPSNQGQSPKGIPVRKIVVNDPNQIPLDYGTTPGGTIFSTTPGGTRIVYERKFLLQCRNSPHSKSPPCNLPRIPGVTEPEEASSMTDKSNKISEAPKENIAPGGRVSQERDDLFQMDI